ncbi:response regulator [Siminovitchia acidinfaciens]|uniref:Response regulator n=1 Tax=Siminovitchia acidinfaciens TaxID=2321395 RepID=A0A429XZV9_9BACI|nr:response regulator [Siminovitchia acidinfaciens]RST74328.1 response regulator [Siminovitchia acidinfaciens]
MKVLIVDDEPLELLNIESILHSFDPSLEIFTAENGMKAWDILEKHKIDIVCLDIRMPGWDGIETLKRIKRKWPHLKVILISAYGEFQYAKEAIASGASAYLLKPVIPEEFIEAFKKMGKEIEHMKSEHSFILQTAVESWLQDDSNEEYINFLHLPIQPNVVVVVKMKSDSQPEKEKWDAKFSEGLQKVIAVPHPIKGVWAYLMESEDLNTHYIKEKLSFLKMALAAEFQEIGWMFGVGEVVNSPADLGKSFYSAIQDTQNKDESIIQHCLDYLSANYASSISLNDLAKVVHLSASHLSRIFKNNLGVTFVDVLTKIRIERAKDLLENKDLSIQFISNRVGFSSPDYFSSTFRKLEGVSPSQYRLKKDGVHPCS